MEGEGFFDGGLGAFLCILKVFFGILEYFVICFSLFLFAATQTMCCFVF